MPVTANVALLLGLFHHLSDGRVALRERKSDYIDLPPTLSKGKMRLGADSGFQKTALHAAQRLALAHPFAQGLLE